MALLTVQFRITLTDVGGVGIIQIRFSTRFPDDRYVCCVQAQIGHIRQLVADGGGRHYVVKVLLKSSPRPTRYFTSWMVCSEGTPKRLTAFSLSAHIPDRRQ